MSNIKYHPHIDGLRAVAVLSVFIFHIENSLLPGGFIGVDIFFVISGYLITSILKRSLQNETYSIKEFYKKRIKRVLPVYYLVAITSFIFAWFIHLPKDFVSFSDSLIASTLFVSNFYFWLTSNYFSGAIELKPLVHTWSLSVEEQFYIFWPLLLAFFFKANKKILIVLCVSIFAISLSASYVFSNTHPSFAYYSIVTRAFELMLGAIAALFYIEKTAMQSRMLSYIGFILITYALIVTSKYDSFPGVIALIPCIGTVFIIVSGSVKTIPIRLLESKLLVYIGLISYSLYMWHWPLLSFARYYYTELTSYQIILIVGVIFLISYLSRTYIEQRVIKSPLNFKKSICYFFLVPSVLIIVAATSIKLDMGKENRFTQEENRLISQTYSSAHDCSKERFNLDFEDKCYIKSQLSTEKGNKSILLWGDSHVEHFQVFFQLLADKESVDIYQMSFPGCPPISGVYRINRSYSNSCYEHNKRVLNFLLNNNQFDYVALAANWQNYAQGSNLADDLDKTISIENSARAFEVNLAEQLSQLSARNIKIIYLNSVPNFESNAAQCVLKNKIFGYPEASTCVTERKNVNKRRESYNEFLHTYVIPNNNILFLDFINDICDDKYCSPYIDGNIMYRDQNHLSNIGSQYLFNKVDTHYFSSFFTN
jgi:peptidoglycan/LPS O-acetylase OafA/YrhL